MNKSIFKLDIKNEDIRIGTWDLSKGFDVEHRALLKLVNKYKNEFLELGVIASAVQKPSSKKGGRPVVEYDLNKPQATYLTTLLTNNEKVRKFKLFITSEFFRQRNL